MSMSAGGNDGLFRMAEHAAPEEGRIMPVDRKYLKSSKTVSLNDAISLMKQRKEDPNKKIAGGLDDNSEHVRKQKTQKAAQVPVSNAASDSHVQTGNHAEENNTNNTNISPENHLPMGNGQEGAAVSQSQQTSATATLSPLSAHPKGRITTSDLMSGITILQHQVDQVLRNTKNLPSLGSSIVPSNTTSSEDAEETHQLKRFKDGRHKVTFLINSMEFSVKCLNMVRDEQAHCLVLAFADDADSFFIPPMQSELKIKFDGLEEPGRLFYFGMCFRIKELGLKFLGFLLDMQNDPVETVDETK